MIHPIPPGYYCVPSALIALTGRDPASVIVPALNRHGAGDGRSLLEAPAGVRMDVARRVLEELGFTVRRYRSDAASGKLSSRVSAWARRSERYPGRPLLISTSGRDAHCLVVQDGQIYDNHVPVGAGPGRHPFRNATVDGAFLVEKRG
jgi:hypothetical protein